VPRIRSAAKRAASDANCNCGGTGPANDECVDAIAIFDGDTPFSTEGATDSGPDLPGSCDEGFGLSLVQDIWYMYTATCNGTLTVSTCDQADYDTRLAAYLDCSGTFVACNDDGPGCSGFTSVMEFTVTTGTTYLIRVGGFGGAGSGTLTISCAGDGNPACPGDGDCCVDNGTPGCDDAACCEAVCAADPFCCDVAWDGICADGAADLCGCDSGVCGPGSGDCCSDNGTPGCDDVTCCEAVCAVDPFCCETSWDGICADEAADMCSGCSSSDCCEANGTPGCDNQSCQDTVCAVDPFCCNIAWDSICAGEASDLCDICP
jgi:hypothetical protein